MSKPNYKGSEQRHSSQIDSLEIIELAINDVEDLAEAFNVIARAAAHDATTVGPLVEGEEEVVLH